MPYIHVLSPNIANQIAAGEVVERPSSVVKELVENAVDAKASCITIEIENGGLDRIYVADNGCGISADDAETAFLRHATSKINSSEDLYRIDTLGFRGEALASIAAVAEVTMITRAEGEELGTKLKIEDGTTLEKSAYGCACGTSMEVKNLFASVPARLKFLKNPRTEASYIADYLSRMMLAKPDVAFTFRNNGKTVYQTFGDGKLYNVLISIFGTGVAPHVAKVDYDDGYLAISGYVGDAELAKPNRSAQSFFINGRYIRSNALSAALLRAYDTRLMVGRFPFAVLSFSLAPSDVDVNVHPTKMEVRFVDEARVSRALTAAAARAMLTPRTFEDLEENRAAQPQTQGERKIAPDAASNVCGMSEQISSAQHLQQGQKTQAAEEEFETVVLPPRVELRGAQQTTRPFVREGAPYTHVARPNGMIGAVQRYSIKPNSDEIRRETPRPRTEQAALIDEPYTIVGVLFDAYWIVQQGENVFYIDQHAAHERRLYEKLMARDEAIVSQKLLIPKTVSLQPLEYETLRTQLPLLEELGYEIEIHEDFSCALSAVPQIRGEALPDRFLFDALHQLENIGKTSDRQLVRSSLIQAACKHAIKAGERIDRAEIEELLQYFKEEGAPLTCPHGRPILVRMTKLEIEKLFKRVL